MVISDPVKFQEQGGTELAPMSTTETREVRLSSPSAFFVTSLRPRDERSKRQWAQRRVLCLVDDVAHLSLGPLRPTVVNTVG